MTSNNCFLDSSLSHQNEFEHSVQNNLIQPQIQNYMDWGFEPKRNLENKIQTCEMNQQSHVQSSVHFPFPSNSQMMINQFLQNSSILGSNIQSYWESNKQEGQAQQLNTFTGDPMGRRRKNKKRKSLFKNKNSQINTCETKNIPKNYGKQIIKFIKTEKELTKQALESNKSKFSYEQFMQMLKKKKKSLNKIEDLRKMWSQYNFSKEFRIMSGFFVRKYSLAWIFNSRIQNIKFPIKYRYKIKEGVQNPDEFKYLKDY